MSDWWQDLYDGLLVQILLEDRDPAQVQATLDWILAQLDVPEGARVFDQCCGIGSLSGPLAARGYSLVGVDQAASYIDRARRDAADAGVSIEYIADDAREFVPSRPCAGAFNWWTSFGYAEDDADNTRMLTAAFASLLPGARFLLDAMNGAAVLRHFKPQVVTRRSLPEGELVLLRESSLDLEGGVLDKRWTYFLPDGRRITHPSRVRLYLPHELERLLRSVGFVDIEFFGGVAGEKLSLDSLRCICSARRPM